MTLRDILQAMQARGLTCTCFCMTLVGGDCKACIHRFSQAEPKHRTSCAC